MRTTGIFNVYVWNRLNCPCHVAYRNCSLLHSSAYRYSYTRTCRPGEGACIVSDFSCQLRLAAFIKPTAPRTSTKASVRWPICYPGMLLLLCQKTLYAAASPAPRHMLAAERRTKCTPKSYANESPSVACVQSVTVIGFAVFGIILATWFSHFSSDLCYSTYLVPRR